MIAALGLPIHDPDVALTDLGLALLGAYCAYRLRKSPGALVMGGLAFADPGPVIDRFSDLARRSAADIQTLHDFELSVRGGFEDL